MQVLGRPGAARLGAAGVGQLRGDRRARVPAGVDGARGLRWYEAGANALCKQFGIFQGLFAIFKPFSAFLVIYCI